MLHVPEIDFDPPNSPRDESRQVEHESIQNCGALAVSSVST
jgi:hypothetical protein